MQTLIGIFAIALAVIGFRSAGVLGAITGLVAAIGVGSGLAIMVQARGTDLDARPSVRRGQRLGGAIAAVACGVGVYYGGWRWGWTWGLLGYVTGTLAALVLGVTGAARQGLAQAESSVTGLPQVGSGSVPILDLPEFATRAGGGRPNRMNMSSYDGAPFMCACGETHHYNAGRIDVLQELSGMRLVFACPHKPFVTCVKVKGVLRFEGFDSLFGAATDGSHAPAV
jgi:hypothetical protein